MDKLLQAYSNEKIGEMLVSNMDDHVNIYMLLEKIYDLVGEVNRKVDVILEKIDALSDSVAGIKREAREIEEKIMLIGSDLDTIANKIDAEDFTKYERICQKDYETWDRLNGLTKSMLPVAEYLFSKLQNYGKPDYSPVILEFCRAVENEFLQKLFSKYTLDLIDRIGKSQIYDFLFEDRKDPNLMKDTSEFSRAIIAASNTRRPEYTIGQMRWILSLLTNDEIVMRSPLLQDFKKFVEKEANINDLLNRGYLKQLNSLIDDYRNPSAHPDFMPLSKASECKKIIPKRIDYFVNCMRQ